MSSQKQGEVVYHIGSRQVNEAEYRDWIHRDPGDETGPVRSRDLLPGAGGYACTQCAGRGRTDVRWGFQVGRNLVCPACNGTGRLPERRKHKKDRRRAI